MRTYNQQGQAMVETMFISIMVIAALFACLQLCVITANALLCNEAAFSAMRAGSISPGGSILENVRNAAETLLIPHCVTSRNNILRYKITCWNNTIEGEETPDHANNNILKYTANIEYDTKIIFPSLIRPFSESVFFSGGFGTVRQTARARLVKSPDERYYYRAYPGAQPFTSEYENSN